MNWRRDTSWLALLELHQEGSLCRRASQEEIFEHLLACGWALHTSRADVIQISERHRRDLEILLEQVRPDWRALSAALREAKQPLTPRGLKALSRARQVDALPVERPELLNQKTAASLLTEHSKARPAQAHLSLLGATLTRDGLVQMRPNAGLELVRGETRADGRALAELQGSLVLTERAMLGGAHLSGRLPRAALTVENLGVFMDMPAPEWLLVVHVPGWNTPAALQILSQLPDTPTAHFGDLDPPGFAIFQHLRRHLPRIRWFVPQIGWDLLVHAPALWMDWPESLEGYETLPPLVQHLIAEKRWLEQEALALHPGLLAELEAFFP